MKQDMWKKQRKNTKQSETVSQWKLLSAFKMHRVSKYIVEIIIQGAILQSQNNSNFSIYFIKLF